MKYKVILFDMDGVLVKSEPVHYRAWMEVIRDLSAEQILSEEDIIGVTDLSLARRIVETTGSDINEHELCQRKIDCFLYLIKQELPTIEGRDFFLMEYLKGVDMAVVSSSSRYEIDAVLKASRIDDLFRFYIGFEDTQMHKPEPEPYILAMQKMGCLSSETLILEDSPTGLEAAIKSGADVIGINTSGILNDNYPVPIFNDYHEIVEWLDFRRKEQLLG